jgi:hypothetical protein
MTSKRPGWTGAEAWIFLSIGDAAGKGRATLDKVIGAADSNNHSIPTIEEFTDAVGQLVGAGLVTAAPDDYGLTDAGQRLFEQINKPKRGHITRFVDTAKEWRHSAPSAARAVPWTLAQDQFHRAFDQYHQWFQEAYRKLKERDAKSPQ